jgi:nucleoid DNA-binding protein
MKKKTKKKATGHKKKQVVTKKNAATSKPKNTAPRLSKSDLVGIVAKKTRQTLKDTKETVDELLDTIAKSAEKGKHICLQNFGTFKQVHRKAREIRSIADGRKKKIPAHTAVKFTASKNL